MASEEAQLAGSEVAYATEDVTLVKDPLKDDKGMLAAAVKKAIKNAAARAMGQTVARMISSGDLVEAATEAFDIALSRESYTEAVCTSVAETLKDAINEEITKAMLEELPKAFTEEISELKHAPATISAVLGVDKVCSAIKLRAMSDGAIGEEDGSDTGETQHIGFRLQNEPVTKTELATMNGPAMKHEPTIKNEADTKSEPTGHIDEHNCSGSGAATHAVLGCDTDIATKDEGVRSQVLGRLDPESATITDESPNATTSKLGNTLTTDADVAIEELGAGIMHSSAIPNVLDIVTCDRLESTVTSRGNDNTRDSVNHSSEYLGYYLSNEIIDKDRITKGQNTATKCEHIPQGVKASDKPAGNNEASRYSDIATQKDIKQEGSLEKPKMPTKTNAVNNTMDAPSGSNNNPSGGKATNATAVNATQGQGPPAPLTKNDIRLNVADSMMTKSETSCSKAIMAASSIHRAITDLVPRRSGPGTTASVPHKSVESLQQLIAAVEQYIASNEDHNVTFARYLRWQLTELPGAFDAATHPRAKILRERTKMLLTRKNASEDILKKALEELRDWKCLDDAARKVLCDSWLGRMTSA
ncbi:hypothetical protein NKR19_g6550 [Coniochaeta hoffmannii]|uniref:Uncharacterized protein n=1 Tax=Coniochaeta hoffmannii TaxID=91930 RepID=A0AA38RRZ4_9PEZI|nr:hypothetical protein NKR19_g6550 [Coniochaeta hoffmannii]